MSIPIEAFALTITDTPQGVHAWTEELFRSTVDSVDGNWRAATENDVSFSVSGFTPVELAAADFPGGDNWQTEPLTGMGRESHSMLTEQAVFFAVGCVNRSHARASPLHVRVHLLPTVSRSVPWAGRGLADLVECYCPRPREDQLSDILIAHELGHVLMGPGHEGLAQNLMFMDQLHISRPPQLTPRQRTLVLASPVFIHWQQQPVSFAPHSSSRRDLRAQARPDPTWVADSGRTGDSGPLLGGGSSRGPLGMPRRG